MINKETINTDEWDRKIRGCIFSNHTHQANKNRILLRLIENLMKNVGELNEKVEKLEKELEKYTNNNDEYLYEPPYKPTCPQGYDDCVCDPAYIHYYYPEWYKKLYGDLTPEEASKQRCDPDDEYCYDDEDK